jgi:hypothetical protein
MTERRKLFLRPAELDQLKQLRDRIGITKLALVLDLPFYTCRSMLDVKRVSVRTLQRVRAHLPGAVTSYLASSPSPEPTTPDHEPLRDVDAEVRATLSTLLPYVSTLRLARALDLSLNTLKAAAAGYRRMHAATAETLHGRLDELLQPPHEDLRATLRAQPVDAVLRGLRVGVLAPLPGMSIAETRSLLLGDAEAEATA